MKHGTTTAYTTHACRCDDCRRANMRAKKSWRIRTRALNGDIARDPINVPVERARQHVAALIASGWTRSQIARETGRSIQALYNLLDRPRGTGPKTIRRDIEAELLAIQPLPDLDDYIDPVLVDRLAWGLVDWRTMNPQPSPRVRAAAADLAWARWAPIRRAEAAWGIAEQDKSGESLTSIERRLGLRAGRDFNRKADVA